MVRLECIKSWEFKSKVGQAFTCWVECGKKEKNYSMLLAIKRILPGYHVVVVMNFHLSTLAVGLYDVGDFCEALDRDVITQHVKKSGGYARFRLRQCKFLTCFTCEMFCELFLIFFGRCIHREGAHGFAIFRIGFFSRRIVFR